MKNLKDYESLVRECVENLSEKDPHWTWTVESCSRDIIRIRWSYLDYCEEKDNCFFLILQDPCDSLDDQTIFVKDPKMNLVDGHFVSDYPENSWQESWENAITRSIEQLASYARSRY